MVASMVTMVMMAAWMPLWKAGPSFSGPYCGMREPIQDVRKPGVLQVAESMSALRLADERVPSERRRRRRSAATQESSHLSRAAAELVDLSSTLSTTNKDTVYLSQEVSLLSTASEVWADLAAKNLSGSLEAASRECGAAVVALGEAAQASLAGKGAAGGWRRRSKAWDLARASSRAHRAVDELARLAGSCAEAADDVLVQGGALGRLDRGWRRDALRAILALQNAPELMQRELQRQRLLRLGPELRMLGLEDAQLETLTVADLREARVARAKEYHPDVAWRGGASGGASSGRRLRHGFARMMRGGSPASIDMSEVNVAHAAVKKAITAPMFFDQG